MGEAELPSDCWPDYSGLLSNKIPFFSLNSYKDAHLNLFVLVLLINNVSSITAQKSKKVAK